MARENTIVQGILNYLNSQKGCVAEKVQGSAISSGKADINACYHGHSLRIEVKTPDHGNKASKKQEMNLERWKSAGACCGIAYSVEDVKKMLEFIDCGE